MPGTRPASEVQTVVRPGHSPASTSHHQQAGGPVAGGRGGKEGVVWWYQGMR
jgi:hypothetical protein